MKYQMSHVKVVNEMDANVISRVSQIIMENRHGVKLPKRVKADSSSGDSVQISVVAADANTTAQSIGQEDDNRAQRVAVIKQQVEKGVYELSDYPKLHRG